MCIYYPPKFWVSSSLTVDGIEALNAISNGKDILDASIGVDSTSFVRIRALAILLMRLYILLL